MKEVLNQRHRAGLITITGKLFMWHSRMEPKNIYFWEVMLLNNVSQSGRYTGINIKLGQGNFTVAIASVRNLYLTVLYFSSFNIGAEIVL